MGDRTTKNHPSDKDGLAKNIDKMGGEWEKMKAAAKESFKEDSHDPLMNAVKEATEASPYGAAHVGVVVIVVLLIALGVAIWI